MPLLNPYNQGLTQPTSSKTANLTGRIFLKLIFAVLCVLVVALTAVDFLASKVAERTYVDTLKRELEEKGRMLALLSIDELGRMDAHKFQELSKAANGRLTIITRDGKVLKDSEANTQIMENHANRPEVIRAFEGGVGSDTRTSKSLGRKTTYVAVPIGNGALRLAVPLRDIQLQVNEIRKQLLAAVALAFLPAILIAAFLQDMFRQSWRASLTMPVSWRKGDFRARLQTGSDELGILTEQLNETGEVAENL
ncbi:MAG: hypothetical protein WKF37_14765 [Bryobacteraceae bacterium]